MKRKSFILCLLFLTSLVFAGPTVIRDNRIHDLAITPNVGRGYSIAANTFQSMCYEEINFTVPSYNLKYRYVEIEKDWETSFSTSFRLSRSLDFFFLKSNVDFKTETSGETELHYHHIFAKISVDSYYHSLNEGTSKMSTTARSLLQKGDIVSFFDSCGSYYVKSLGRHSDFLALLRYRTESNTRDFNFELKLKSKLRGFFGGGGSSSVEVDGEFHSETQTKALSITIWANGLGKDVLADLIPTDIPSFKKTIQEVIKTMQDADTGIVTTMEISPWVENTEFQDLLDLDEEGGANALTDHQKNLFKEKKNLEANAELIAEFDRIDRGQMDLYFKSLNCRRILDNEYLSVKDEDDEPFYVPELTYFHDLTARGQNTKMARMSLLDQWLDPETVVEEFLNQNTLFIMGNDLEANEGAGNGAAFCIDKLNEAGLREIHFREVAECQNARKFAVPLSSILDRYCMPELGRIDPPQELSEVISTN